MTRQARDIRGMMFPVEFEIIDRLDSPEAIAARTQAAADGTKPPVFPKPSAPYTVKVLLSVCLLPPLCVLPDIVAAWAIPLCERLELPVP